VSDDFIAEFARSTKLSGVQSSVVPLLEQTYAVSVKTHKEGSFNPWNYYKKINQNLWHLLLEDNISHRQMEKTI
jgi:hypothetical protein